MSMSVIVITVLNWLSSSVSNLGSPVVSTLPCISIVGGSLTFATLIIKSKLTWALLSPELPLSVTFKVNVSPAGLTSLLSGFPDSVTVVSLPVWL